MVLGNNHKFFIMIKSNFKEIEKKDHIKYIEENFNRSSMHSIYKEGDLINGSFSIL